MYCVACSPPGLSPASKHCSSTGTDTLLHFPACGCDRQEAGPSVAFDDAPADVPFDFVDQVAEGLELAVRDAFLVCKDKIRRE